MLMLYLRECIITQSLYGVHCLYLAIISLVEAAMCTSIVITICKRIALKLIPHAFWLYCELWSRVAEAEWYMGYQIPTYHGKPLISGVWSSGSESA